MFLAFFSFLMIYKLCIFQTIQKLWSNHVWRHFWFLHCQKLHLQPLATLEFFSSGLQIIQIWSINYYILKMPRYTSIVCIGRYLVLTYIERFVSTVCCFFSYICWSLNCMSWISKLSNFSWHKQKLRQDLYLRALILPFMDSSFLTPWYFFCFLYLVCKLFKRFFHSYFQSVNHGAYLGDVTQHKH